MATMIRVSLPDGGPATVSAGVVTYGGCLTGELAVLVGDSVARNRCGSELREALYLWAQTPKDPTAPAALNRQAYVGAPGVPGDQLPASQPLAAAAPDETQVGIILGDAAAAYLDRSNLLEQAVERAMNLFPSTFGV